MLLDVAGSELVLIAAVALVVLGPEELLPLMRRMGRWIGKVQGQINHWRWQLHNESIIESGLGIDPRLDPLADTPKPALKSASKPASKPAPKTAEKVGGKLPTKTAVKPTTKPIPKSTTNPTSKAASSQSKAAPKKPQSSDKPSK
jgi:sec-independent protein translocase protein TatB